MKKIIGSVVDWLDNHPVVLMWVFLCVGIVFIAVAMGIPAYLSCASRISEKTPEGTHTKVLWTENIHSAHHSRVEKLEVEGKAFYRFFNNKGYFQIIPVKEEK